MEGQVSRLYCLTLLGVMVFLRNRIGGLHGWQWIVSKLDWSIKTNVIKIDEPGIVLP